MSRFDLPINPWRSAWCLLWLCLTLAGLTTRVAAQSKPASDSDDAFLRKVETDLNTRKPAKSGVKATTPNSDGHEHEGISIWDLVTPREKWSTLVSGYREGIYRNPILAGAFAGALLAFLGVFIVLRRMVFVSAAISQASVCGVAFAHVLHSYVGIASVIASPRFGALIFGLSASLLFILNPTRFGITREALLGQVFLVASAVGLGLRDRIAAEGHDIDQAIFGHAVSVPDDELRTIVLLTLFLGPALLIARRSLLVIAFDKTSARVQQMPVRTLEGFLFLSIGTAIALSTKILGALPVFAYTVLPAMGALAFSKRPWLVFVLAVTFGALSGAGGYAVATIFGYPVGASQTALAGVFAVSGALTHWVVDRFRR